MGILSSLKEIGQYKKHEKKDKILERDIIKATISDGQFMTRYSSFVEALEKKLAEEFYDLSRSKVYIKPNKTEDARFFEQTTFDERVTDLYHVARHPDGTYSYEPKIIDLDLS